MAIYKRCNRCHELFQGKECPACKKKSQSAYQKRKRQEDESKKVYSLGVWKKCRNNVIAKYLGYDIWLLAVGQEYVCTDDLIVHHILEREERPDLLFNIDNLVTVSRESHEEIHKEYLINKPAAILRIKKGIEEFNRLFGEE